MSCISEAKSPHVRYFPLVTRASIVPRSIGFLISSRYVGHPSSTGFTGLANSCADASLSMLWITIFPRLGFIDSLFPTKSSSPFDPLRGLKPVAVAGSQAGAFDVDAKGAGGGGGGGGGTYAVGGGGASAYARAG